MEAKSKDDGFLMFQGSVAMILMPITFFGVWIYSFMHFGLLGLLFGWLAGGIAALAVGAFWPIAVALVVLALLKSW